MFAELLSLSRFLDSFYLLVEKSSLLYAVEQAVEIFMAKKHDFHVLPPLTPLYQKFHLHELHLAF